MRLDVSKHLGTFVCNKTSTRQILFACYRERVTILLGHFMVNIRLAF